MEKIFIKTIKQHIFEIILMIMAVAYSVYFTIASFLRYTNYNTGRFDLGNMSQTVWNTIHGQIFLLTNPNGTTEVSRLAFHADFILILLSPFYLLWEDPRMLLLIQTLVLAMGGVFVYLLANKIIKDEIVALAIAGCYFLNPAVNYTNLYDFHAVTLATSFFIGAFYFIEKKKYIFAIFFLVLAGLTKEQVWAINALIGIYLIFFKKERILGLFTTIVSAFLFYFLIWIAIPHFLGNQHFALSYYSEFGDSPSTVIKNIFLSPVKTLQILFMHDRIAYIKQLFMPLGYLSFLALPFLIFAAPDLGINLLSTNPQLHQIYYQYSASVTPFIFISLIYAISFLRRKINFIPLNIYVIFILILTLISAYTFGPLPFAKKPTIDMFVSPLTNRKTVDNYLNSIPLTDSISSTNNLGSNLSHRRNIYTIPSGIDIADTIIYLIDKSSTDNEKASVEKMLKDPKYYLVLSEDNFYVFKKR